MRSVFMFRYLRVTVLVHTASGWLLRLDGEGFAYPEDEDLETVSHMKGVSRAT